MHILWNFLLLQERLDALFHLLKGFCPLQLDALHHRVHHLVKVGHHEELDGVFQATAGVDVDPCSLQVPQSKRGWTISNGSNSTSIAL